MAGAAFELPPEEQFLEVIPEDCVVGTPFAGGSADAPLALATCGPAQPVEQLGPEEFEGCDEDVFGFGGDVGVSAYRVEPVLEAAPGGRPCISADPCRHHPEAALMQQ